MLVIDVDPFVNGSESNRARVIHPLTSIVASTMRRRLGRKDRRWPLERHSTEHSVEEPGTLRGRESVEPEDILETSTRIHHLRAVL